MKKKESEQDLKQAVRERQKALAARQSALKERRLPVLAVIDGWGAAGKGSVIARVIRELDPRFFNVVSYGTATEEERRKPFLWRYASQLPEKGKFVFFDSGWLGGTMRELRDGALSERDYPERLQSINAMERRLCDDGFLLVKVFLDISKKEQKNRMDALTDDKDTAWRVSDDDRWQNAHYEQCRGLFDGMMTATGSARAPWHMVNGANRDSAALEIFDLLIAAIDAALAAGKQPAPLTENLFPLRKMPLLGEADLDKELPPEKYERQLAAAQKTLRELHNRLYRKRVPVVLVFEGWDAAGKGGNIKRLTGALDPRGFEVMPIAAPEPHELARHYLWRFWKRLPKTGHVALFDRSWYGRVMVERVEGFCTENDWQRAFNEINEFEHELTDWGAVVIKFWLQIDKDTQLARFTERQSNPEKQWKITDEDWRNREKWDAYELAVNEMLQKTSTKSAPWHIIESVDKRYARIRTLNIVIAALKKALD